MPDKKLKALFGDFLIALADLLSKQKKVLDQQSFQKELEAFIRDNNINSNNFDLEKFQSDFIKYLKNKNYSCDDMSVRVQSKTDEDLNENEAEIKNLPKNIRKISEDLNACIGDLCMFVDTTKMAAGLVCYTIEKIPPTEKKPYVTYKPDARVITQIHDNGVNGGTIFLTCAHKIVKSMDFNGEKNAVVVSDDEAIYTPLTKEHADYICKILNAQSRIFYAQRIKRQQKTK